MSIQPNRVLYRIVEQVEQSDWPELDFAVFDGAKSGELVRLYAAPYQERYATPIHFWVHALRDELAARDRREDLVGAAGHAMCVEKPLSQWTRELDRYLQEQKEAGASMRTFVGRLLPQARGYRMYESACRRSSVVDGGERWIAHFWGHGLGESWRRGMTR